MFAFWLANQETERRLARLVEGFETTLARAFRLASGKPIETASETPARRLNCFPRARPCVRRREKGGGCQEPTICTVKSNRDIHLFKIKCCESDTVSAN